ncbi:MAG: peptidoglycan-binding domain-containing protein [Desulfonatronovibrionaceae bacterium]
MSRKYIHMVLIVICCWTVTGCKAQQHLQKTRAAYEEAPFTVNAPEIQHLQNSEVPADIRMVTAALVQKLRQAPEDIPRVEFNPSGYHYSPESSFKYQGFAVTDIRLIDQWARSTGADSFSCRVQGVLSFADQLGRRTLLEYTADYELFKGRIVIQRSEIIPLPPIFPRTAAFILEGRKLKHIVDQKPDFTAFYAGVVQESIPMTPTAREKAQYEAYQEMSFFERLRNAPNTKKDEYFMVIFVMDRLTPDADLEVLVTESLYGKKSLANVVYRDFHGWRVAVFGGEFAIGSDLFHAKVYYHPAPGVLPEGREEVLVGLFTSEKNYNVQPADQASQALTPGKASHSAPSEGPLASGAMLLVITDNQDASRIQARLKDLGFYTMKVDGIWGPGSKGALEKFQMSSGLQPSGKWDMGTQMKLFAGTGQ